MGRKKEVDCAVKIPEVSQQLARRLRELLDEDQFVEGTFNCVQSIESQIVLLNFIEHGQDVSVSSVAVLAFKLACKGETCD